jgi:hypothetical protein
MLAEYILLFSMLCLWASSFQSTAPRLLGMLHAIKS